MGLCKSTLLYAARTNSGMQYSVRKVMLCAMAGESLKEKLARQAAPVLGLTMVIYR
jgi:hypothetical protein